MLDCSGKTCTSRTYSKYVKHALGQKGIPQTCLYTDFHRHCRNQNLWRAWTVEVFKRVAPARSFEGQRSTTSKGAPCSSTSKEKPTSKRDKGAKGKKGEGKSKGKKQRKKNRAEPF